MATLPDVNFVVSAIVGVAGLEATYAAVCAGKTIGLANKECLVAAGELVLGRTGAVSRVVDIERPQLGGRRLYAFNGGAPFVTAEHPFLSERGWCAIDPAADSPRRFTFQNAAHLADFANVGCRYASHDGSALR